MRHDQESALLLLEAFCLALGAKRTVSALTNRLRCRAAVSKTGARRERRPRCVRSFAVDYIVRWLTKVDSTSGSEVATGQALAELLTHEKNRCILVIAPAGVLAGHPSPAPDRGRNNFRDSCGDNRVRVSRDVVHT